MRAFRNCYRRCRKNFGACWFCPPVNHRPWFRLLSLPPLPHADGFEMEMVGEIPDDFLLRGQLGRNNSAGLLRRRTTYPETRRRLPHGFGFGCCRFAEPQALVNLGLDSPSLVLRSPGNARIAARIRGPNPGTIGSQSLVRSAKAGLPADRIYEGAPNHR